MKWIKAIGAIFVIFELFFVLIGIYLKSIYLFPMVYLLYRYFRKKNIKKNSDLKQFYISFVGDMVLIYIINIPVMLLLYYLQLFGDGFIFFFAVAPLIYSILISVVIVVLDFFTLIIKFGFSFLLHNTTLKQNRKATESIVRQTKTKTESRRSASRQEMQGKNFGRDLKDRIKSLMRIPTAILAYQKHISLSITGRIKLNRKCEICVKRKTNYIVVK